MCTDTFRIAQIEKKKNNVCTDTFRIDQIEKKEQKLFYVHKKKLKR